MVLRHQKKGKKEYFKEIGNIYIYAGFNLTTLHLAPLWPKN